jgi:hypothetical protein
MGTGGNLAIPLTPLEASLGEIRQFCVYHLMEVSDPASNFPYFAVDIGPLGATGPRDPKFGLHPPGASYHLDNVPIANGTHDLREQEGHLNKLLQTGDGIFDDGLVALPALAEILHTKNAGPYEITFDIVFRNLTCHERAQKARKN